MQIWCCEAQERYVLAISPQKLDLFKAIALRERCPFAVVGHATLQRQLVVTDRDSGSTPIDLPMDILFGKPPRMSRNTDSQNHTLPRFDSSPNVLSTAMELVLSLPSVASKSFL